MTKLAISNARTLFLVVIFLIPSTLLATQLHLLVRANDVNAVSDYIKGTPRAMIEINMVFQNETPLQIARSLGNHEMVQILISHGAREYEMLSNSPFRRKPNSYDVEYSRSTGATSAAFAKSSIPEGFPAPGTSHSQGATAQAPIVASAKDDNADASDDAGDDTVDNSSDDGQDNGIAVSDRSQDSAGETLIFEFDD